jgi:Peptidase inhibitor I78 family
MKATNAGTLRWAWPNSALTMDFRSDRATVTLSSDGKVSKIDCG